jgi:hypothetical protein
LAGNDRERHEQPDDQVKQVTAGLDTGAGAELACVAGESLGNRYWTVRSALVVLPPMKRAGKQYVAIAVGNYAGEVRHE